ncbi:17038_t:CDS:2, partial [Gigaspora margarita]
MSVAKFIDNINVRYYSRKLHAQYAHSRFAIQKMVTIIIGKVNEKVCENGLVILGDGPTYQNIERKSVEIDTKIHQDEKVNTGIFLPGHYIEVQSRVNNLIVINQIVIRSYTPLENEQLIGYKIQAHGPFDVCNRKALYPYSRLIVTLPTTKMPLLNPDNPDGSWDKLYMIADVIDGELFEDIALSSREQLAITYCLSELPSDWGETLKISPNLQFISEITLPLSKESKGSIIQFEQSENIQKYEDKPVLSSKKSRSLTIDLDLANSKESYGLLKEKIVVSSPF